MPVDIQSLRERRVRVTLPVTFFDQTVEVQYDPLKLYAPDFRSQWRKREQEITAAHQEFVSSLAGARKAQRAGEEVDPELLDILEDDLALSRRVWAGHAELCCMLIEDWDIVDGGRPLPIEPEQFLNGTLPPELANEISKAVWADVRKLGNRNASATTG